MGGFGGGGGWGEGTTECAMRLQNANAVVADTRRPPTGTIRVDAPPSLGPQVLAGDISIRARLGRAERLFWGQVGGGGRGEVMRVRGRIRRAYNFKLVLRILRWRFLTR